MTLRIKTLALTGLFVAGLAAATSAPVIAHDGEEHPIVDARRGYYKLLGVNMGALAAMAKGEAEYDAKKATTHANNMMALTKYDVSGLYAPGTSNADLPGKTRALPKIWSDSAGVQEKGKAYFMALTELAANAGKSRKDLGMAVKKLGGTCKGCHDSYRAKDF